MFLLVGHEVRAVRDSALESYMTGCSEAAATRRHHPLARAALGPRMARATSWLQLGASVRRSRARAGAGQGCWPRGFQRGFLGRGFPESPFGASEPRQGCEALGATPPGKHPLQNILWDPSVCGASLPFVEVRWKSEVPARSSTRPTLAPRSPRSSRPPRSGRRAWTQCAHGCGIACLGTAFRGERNTYTDALPLFSSFWALWGVGVGGGPSSPRLDPIGMLVGTRPASGPGGGPGSIGIHLPSL